MFGGSIHAPLAMQHSLEQPGTTLNSGVPSLGQKQNIGLCVQHSGLPRNSLLSCLTWSTDSLAQSLEATEKRGKQHIRAALP